MVEFGYQIPRWFAQHKIIILSQDEAVEEEEELPEEEAPEDDDDDEEEEEEEEEEEVADEDGATDGKDELWERPLHTIIVCGIFRPFLSGWNCDDETVDSSLPLEMLCNATFFTTNHTYHDECCSQFIILNGSGQIP